MEALQEPFEGLTARDMTRVTLELMWAEIYGNSPYKQLWKYLM